MGIANCKLKDNTQYGVYAVNFSDPDIHNCTFIGNSSGGVKCDYSWPIISKCIFDGNDITVHGVFASDSVVEMADCTVKNHTEVAIYALSNTTIDLDNCWVKDNGYGVCCSVSSPSITRSVMENNGGEGLWCTSGCDDVSVTNSVIRFNGKYGIYLEDSRKVSIKNNWIHNNGANDDNDSGIFIKEQVSPPLIRNNTIVNNLPNGVYSYSGHEPNIVNCIVYGNTVQIETLSGEPLENVSYNCIQGGYPGVGNIDSDPGFMNIDIDTDDLHLDETSQCKDAGDPNGDYGDETDIDGEERIRYERVDMGADEYYWSPADFDEDGFVNFIDYAILAAAWRSEPNDVNYNDVCDLQDNNNIDFNDLVLFCDDWLWQAAWPEKEILLATDFESGIPAGWTVVDGLNDDETWTTNNPGERSSEYWTGDFCIVDSFWAASVDMNEALITPSIDCSGAVEVILEFSHYFEKYSSEKCDVDISIDNGPWQTVLQYTGSSTGGNITEDISALAADQSNVRIRWHYYDANYEDYWGIDNVEIIGNFRIPPMQMSMGGGREGFVLEGMILESAVGIESAEAVLTGRKDDLMLSSAIESLAARPERLRSKSAKFYAVNAFNTVSALRKMEEPGKEIEEVDIKKLLDWLAEIWLDPQVRKVIDAEDWLKLYESLKKDLE